jgi:hypothetical protein
MRPEYSPSAWEQKGFTEDSARLWAELGLSPEEAQSFYKAGFSVEEARPWVEVGFKNAKRCKKWREAGFKPEETQVYESFGLNIEHAKRLKNWKITALHLSPYRGQTKLTDSLNKLLSDLDSLKANFPNPPQSVSDFLYKESELLSVLPDKIYSGAVPYFQTYENGPWVNLLERLEEVFGSAMMEQLDPDILIEAAQQEVSAAELLKAQVYGVPPKDYLKYRWYGLSLMQASKLFQAGAKSEDYVKGVEQGLTYSEILEVFLCRVNLSEYLHLRKHGITLRGATFVAQGLQKIEIEGPLSISSPLIIERSSLTLKNVSLKTLRVSDSQVILEGCSFPEEKYLPSPRLEIVSSEVALEGGRIERGEVGIHVRDSRLTLREVSITTWLWGVGMRVEGQTEVKGDQLSIRQCGRGMEVRPGARVQLTRPTLSENETGIVVEEADLVLKGPGALTHHQGPAILVEKNGTLSAEELTFEKNQKNSSTGQIHLVGASKVSLQKITVQNSEAKGIYAKDCPDIRMTNSSFTSNLYEAIRLVKSRLIVSEVKILQNDGVERGRYFWQVALYDQAHLKIEKSSIEHGKYGGIWAKSSEVEIADCIVAHHKTGGLVVRDGSTGKVVGGTFRANRKDQIAGYDSTVEVQGAVLHGDAQSEKGLSAWESNVAIKKCHIHSHNTHGIIVFRGSLCAIEDSQLENNGLESSKDGFCAQLIVGEVGEDSQVEKNDLESSKDGFCAQLVVGEVEKVALSDLRVIGGGGGGVDLDSCKNASLTGKSIIRGNQWYGLDARQTQLTVENAEFQDNSKASTPDFYSYQIIAGGASNVQLKEVQVYEGQHSGGIVLIEQSTVKLEGGRIYGHGREAILVIHNGSKIVIIGARISENAQQDGAQVIVVEGSAAEMEDTCIQDSPHGGALVEDGGILILKRCQVHNNKAYNLKREGTGRVEFIDMSPLEDSSES